jgi:hypothetical protein
LRLSSAQRRVDGGGQESPERTGKLRQPSMIGAEKIGA